MHRIRILDHLSKRLRRTRHKRPNTEVIAVDIINIHRLALFLQSGLDAVDESQKTKYIYKKIYNVKCQDSLGEIRQEWREGRDPPNWTQLQFHRQHVEKSHLKRFNMFHVVLTESNPTCITNINN